MTNIISYDFGGRHNADIEKSAARVLEGGTWKKRRIIVVMPAAKMIPTLVALSHWNIVFPPNNAIFRMVAQGTEVGEAYSEAIRQIVNHPELKQWEFVLTIEHDNMPPPDGVISLLKALDAHPEFSAIGGLYWCKGEGGCAHIWGDPTDPVPNFRPQVPKPEQVQECCGLSMGFTLWRLSTFLDKRLPQPLFKTKIGAEGIGTQDLMFWQEARKHGHRCAVDCRVKVGHHDFETGITW